MKKIFIVLGFSIIFMLQTIVLQAQTFTGYSDDSLMITRLEFDVNSSKSVRADELFYSLLRLSSDHRFAAFDSSAVTADIYSRSYMQYYKGIEVEPSSIRLHFKNRKLYRFLGCYLPVSNFDTACAVSPAKAQAIYRQHYGIAPGVPLEFSMQKLFIASPDSNRTPATLPLLCYRLLAYGRPDDHFLYINVKTGDVAASAPTASALMPEGPPEEAELHTRYYNTQHVRNTEYGYPAAPPYVLQITEENAPPCHWQQVILLPSAHFPPYTAPQYSVPSNLLFHDNDNYWTLAEHSADNYAQDALWSLNKIHYYFRDTWQLPCSGSMAVYIDYDHPNFTDNAKAVNCGPYYNEMKGIVIGKASQFKPMTTIDILAHEYAHYLNYRFRVPGNWNILESSTALTESLGDIWGATMEHYYAPDAPNETWKIGERETGDAGYSCLRNLAIPEDPQALLQTASHYGSSAYSAGSGYVKSGVLSHWFYLIVEGGNCNQPIGWDRAVNLVWNAQRNYLVNY
ncbi:MAG: M4 family metallopeptidase, partial [Bacteroidales bacterium]|nr:M4 family metallopeptidase [Bacteroidales bacterium]